MLSSLKIELIQTDKYVEIMKKKPEWISKAEEDIRLGRGQKVRKKLRGMQKRGVPKDLVFEVAFLARRVGMYQFATNILSKEIFQVGNQASPKVIAEYAHCLNGVGYYLEAQEIFKKLPEDLIRENAVSYAGCLLHTWNYHEGLKILETYRPASFFSYQELVYGLNLISAQIACGETMKAKELLVKMLKVCEINNYHIIQANCQELLGQIEFLDGNNSEAYKLFSKSEKALRSSNNVSWLYSLKWKAICELAIYGEEGSIKVLNEVRLQARKFMHWETLRDCDLHHAILTKNQELFNRVYFGTPNEHYRKKALKLSNGQIPLDAKIQIGPKSQNPEFTLNLNTVEFNPTSISLKMDDLQKNLLLSITKDLYRPRSVYQVFKDVYTQEAFNPLSSNKKTGKLIQRFRKILNLYPAQCTIEYRRGYGYRFRSAKPITLIYPNSAPGKRYSKSENIVDQLQDKFGKTTFSRKQVCDLLNLNERAGNRLIKELHSSEQIEIIGSGRATKYKVAS